MMQFTRVLPGPCQSCYYCGESQSTVSPFQSYKSLKHHREPFALYFKDASCCSKEGFVVLLLISRSVLSLCDPTDCSTSAFSVQEARILECIAMSFSRGSSQLRDQTQVSCIAGGLFSTEPPEKHDTGKLPVCLVAPLCLNL